MNDEDRRKMREALAHIRELRQELEITRKMLEACEKNRERLERRVGELLADLTAIARMDGKE